MCHAYDVASFRSQERGKTAIQREKSVMLIIRLVFWERIIEKEKKGREQTATQKKEGLMLLVRIVCP